MQRLVLTLLGPTGSGKTAFAMELAVKLPSEIVCLDATTVYREFNIGSSKPSALDREKVPHHLVDILDPLEPFSAHHFVERAAKTIREIHERNKIAILVGGTYFYLRALQHGMYPISAIPAETIETIEKEYYEEEFHTDKMHEELKRSDPKAAESIHPNDSYRLVRALAILRATGQKPSELRAKKWPNTSQWIWSKYALVLPRHELNQKIVERTELMLRLGLVEETKKLLEKYPQARALGSIGYHECRQLLQKQLTEKQIRNEIIEKTRQLAKRQWTWLRSDSEIKFIDSRDLARVEYETKQLLLAVG